MATPSASSTSTLDGKEILKEGWLTVHKSRNPTFLTKQKVCAKHILKLPMKLPMALFNIMYNTAIALTLVNTGTEKNGRDLFVHVHLIRVGGAQWFCHQSSD